MEKYLPFLAIFAPFVVFWKQFSSWLLYIFRLFVKKVELEQRVGIKLLQMLESDYLSFSFGNYLLRETEAYNSKSNKLETIYLKSKVKILSLYKNIFPVWVSASPVDSFYTSTNLGNITITYFKGVFPFEKYIESISSKINNESQSNNCNFHYTELISGSLNSREKPSQPQGQTLYDAKSRSALLPIEVEIEQNMAEMIGGDIRNYSIKKTDEVNNKYSFTEEGLKVKGLVEKWLNAKDWYTNRGIRYYRGCCVHSKPGFGKSSLIKEIAKRLNIPLFIFDLSSMVNNELTEKLSNISKQPGIVLFEDFDCVFHGRTNINKTEDRGGLTFDCFINQLSGAQAIDNKFVFITTNFIDLLDEAVLRPGRIDDIIELTGLSNKERARIAKIIVGEDCEKLLEEGENDTPAEFENRCIKESLERFWRRD